jgi:dTDP-L-rhamnose 4-epimerase
LVELFLEVLAMSKRILVTGGAGFIGSFLANRLLSKGYHVTVLDNLEPQVHGKDGSVPDYLSKDVEFVKGDIRDYDLLKKVIMRSDIIFHFAAMVGVGQSMYDIQKYVDVNCSGTATLLDIVVNEKANIDKIIIASSMSCYGEGAYKCSQCGNVYPFLRSNEQLASREWEMKCPRCSSDVKPIPTDESKPLFPTSVYATTKRDQEELFLTVGRAHDIPSVALRFFNVYGPNQSLSNPYTGVIAIFSSRLINRHPPLVFEDGLQSRDFIHVSDIVEGSILAMEKDEANYNVFNVGTGIRTNLAEMLKILKKELDPKDEIEPQIVNKFREGDIRHCYADISKIKNKLGFQPKIKVEEGLKTYIDWVKIQISDDKVEQAYSELDDKKLIK